MVPCLQGATTGGGPLTPLEPPGSAGEGFAGAVAPTDMPAAIGADGGAPLERRYGRVRLVSWGRPEQIAEASSGILRPLAQVAGNLTFRLLLDATSEEGASEAVLENTIKETFGRAGRGWWRRRGVKALQVVLTL